MSKSRGLPKSEWRDYFDRMSKALPGNHLIRRPREIMVEEDAAGLLSVAVVDRDGTRQIVRLKQPLTLPAANQYSANASSGKQ